MLGLAPPVVRIQDQRDFSGSLVGTDGYTLTWDEGTGSFTLTAPVAPYTDVQARAATGWTRAAGVIGLTTLTDQVAIGAATPVGVEDLYVAAGARIDGNLGLNAAPHATYRLDTGNGAFQARIGVARLGEHPSQAGHAYFAHDSLNHAAGGNYALLQGSTGATYLNAASGQMVYLRINNADATEAQFDGTKLRLPSVVDNRRLELYRISDNGHQFYGLGINNDVLRFQVPASTSSYVWYRGDSSSASTEIGQLTGVGQLRLPIAGSTGGIVCGTDWQVYRSASNYGLTTGSFEAQTALYGGTTTNGSGVYAGGGSTSSNLGCGLFLRPSTSGVNSNQRNFAWTAFLVSPDTSEFRVSNSAYGDPYSAGLTIMSFGPGGGINMPANNTAGSKLTITGLHGGFHAVSITGGNPASGNSHGLKIDAGSTSSHEVLMARSYAGTSLFTVWGNGLVTVPTTGVSAGLLIGGEGLFWRNTGHSSGQLTFGTATDVGSNRKTLFWGNGGWSTNPTLANSDTGYKAILYDASPLSYIIGLHFNIDGRFGFTSGAATNQGFAWWTFPATTPTLIAHLTGPGQLRLETQGSTGGYRLGGDWTVYRDASNVGRTGGTFIADTALNAGTSVVTGLINVPAAVSNTPRVAIYNPNGAGHAAISTYQTGGDPVDVMLGANYYWGAGGSANRFDTGKPSAAVTVEGMSGIVRFLVGSGAPAEVARFNPGLMTFADGTNLVFNTTTGTKIGTATTQKLSFWNATPVVQPTGIADADGTLADITTKFNSWLAKAESLGLLAVA